MAVLPFNAESQQISWAFNSSLTTKMFIGSSSMAKIRD